MKLRTWILLFFSLLSVLVSAQSGFKESSILKSGKWYKIRVETSGVYKLPYSKLKDIGFDTPENIRVYGQGGKQLSYLNETEVPNDLEEIPLYEGGSSGSKFYLFYGEGVETTYYDEESAMFLQKIHDYAVYNYYYITTSFGAGKRIEEVNTNSLIVNQNRSTYDWVGYYEEENLNLDKTGRQWFSNQISGGVFTWPFSIPDFNSNFPVSIKTSLAVRSAENKTVGLYANNTQISSLSFSSVSVTNPETTYARLSTRIESFNSNSGQIDIKFVYQDNGGEDKAFVDYITLNARSNLKMSSDAFFFRDKSAVGADAVTSFTLSNASSTIQIWDITNHSSVYSFSKSLNGSTLSFNSKTDTLQEFVAVNTSGSFAAPLFIDFIESQNIHGLSSPELVVVTHPAFIIQAEELAQLHRDSDKMSVVVLTTDQVYNEFSSGKPDASAIRNMARMFYERSNVQDSLKYLLLFGDGSYSNRVIFNINASKDDDLSNNINPNYIPTYQSENSLSPTSSYVTDDFYAILGVGDKGIKGELCIGVGRIPVNSDGKDELEAQAVVNKITQYYDNDSKVMSDWRNNMIFLGDDGESSWDSTIFMTDSDKLANIVASQVPAMNLNKIYLDAYQQLSSSTGAAYPEVEDALKDAFNKGALVFNYMGHGGENAITQEQVLTKSDFEKMTNAPYFPLFITATCQLSRYDNVEITNAQYAKKVSAGEAAFLNPDGGAIAMLTTTRLVYQSSNKQLSDALYEVLFRTDYKGDRYRLGDLIRLAKNNTSASKENTLKFALLGDPAITLAHGQYNVITDSVNKVSVKEPIDTLSALSEITISGYIAFSDSSIINNFNGIVYTSVFDKAYTVTSNGNDGTGPIDFILQDKLLFRGKSSVVNGRFKTTFKVPKDISYSFGNGKISYYAENGVFDAKGSYSEFIIGGTAKDPEIDMEGPEISLYMNNKNFVDGGITDPNPILVAEVFDTNGINTTGNGIGHNLSGVLDNDLSRSYLLNDYFVGDTDNYRKGKLEYPLVDLEEGYHSIAVKVWDTYNNSSEEIINFYVDHSNNLTIKELLNYPNPARTYTTFQYSHNSPGTDHTVRIDIYDITGRVIYNISRTNSEDGYVSEPYVWEFSGGIGASFEPGVYPYRMTVTTSDGNEGNQSGSLIIIP